MTEPDTRPKTSRIDIRVERALLDRLDRIANEIGVDRSQLIRRMLAKHINQNPFASADKQLRQTAAKENVVAFAACQSCHHSPECEWFSPMDGGCHFATECDWFAPTNGN